MVELIKNEIGDNKISEKIGEINWIEAKIKDSYKEIYETKNELQGLKQEVSNNLSGEKLKSLIESELTTDHVKNVLDQALSKFGGKNDMATFNEVYSNMGAGLVFNLQLALAKLGCKFDNGIDGLYGSKDTRKRVEEFQTAWNLACPEQPITPDGWAGYTTIQKIISALNDPSWDKSKVVRNVAPVAPTTPTTETTPVTTTPETPNKQEVDKQKQQVDKNLEEGPKNVTADQANEHPEQYHLKVDENGDLAPEDGWEFIEPNNDDNYATQLTAEKRKEFEDLKKKLDQIVYPKNQTNTNNTTNNNNKVNTSNPPVSNTETTNNRRTNTGNTNTNTNAS